MNAALIIFIKNPVLGKVKTRLAKKVGPNNALKVYQSLLEHTLEVTCELDKVDKFVYYNKFIPAYDEWLQQDYSKALQKGKDLGEKMCNAFQAVFEEGHPKVVLVMPDCPKMSNNILKKSFMMLDDHDFVIGPTLDGGYYLIGMKSLHPEIFSEKEYSTSHTFSDAVQTMKALGKNYFMLPALRDIDLAEDLDALRKPL